MTVVKLRKKSLALFILFAVLSAIWIYRYPLLYYYYQYRINNADSLADLEIQTDNVKKISPHIIPYLVKSYIDTNASRASRGLAAYGLIEADKNTADVLFVRYLDSNDENTLSLAISNLGMTKNLSQLNRIIAFSEHHSKLVRMSVVDYLGEFKNEEVIDALKQMKNNDQDADVRGWAAYKLKIVSAE